jgi:hypothetical protein
MGRGCVDGNKILRNVENYSPNGTGLRISHSVTYFFFFLIYRTFLVVNLLTLGLQSASSYASDRVMSHAVRCWSLSSGYHSQSRVPSHGFCGKHHDSRRCSSPPPQFIHTSFPNHHSTIIWWLSHVSARCERPDQTTHYHILGLKVRALSLT